MEKALPPIPAKRYFTIGEVSELCGVKPYVLRYWEQEFTQLKPMKRRGNRRYYQHHEVLLIRRIRELLYDQGFTIIGARNRLIDAAVLARSVAEGADEEADTAATSPAPASAVTAVLTAALTAAPHSAVALVAVAGPSMLAPLQLRAELMSIRELLSA